MSEDAPQYLVDTSAACALCAVDRGRIAWSAPLALALWDLYPVSLGHALVVPPPGALDLTARPRDGVRLWPK